jgi:hypothetical protein
MKKEYALKKVLEEGSKTKPTRMKLDFIKTWRGSERFTKKSGRNERALKNEKGLRLLFRCDYFAFF